ncbi:hypothetical protein BC937DRAFT_95669 [Endogone sp. FLAS-F59071]|nr:hypothetical protein BC937DRAFT_95669 [Endogone sp. FLAS-F59071]|eukprot:RUS13210.1 hypothetical protein BC937DRAFT_95669 [Endogone sp. FLAS-F59071]
MRIFHDLKASRLDPIFTLKRGRPSSESVASPSSTSIRYSRPNSVARSIARMPWSPLWTGANFEGGDLVWDGVEGVLPKELVQQQCIRIAYRGQSKLLHVQSATTPQEVMIRVLDKFYIDRTRASEFEICLMTGHEKSTRPLSSAELLAICSSPSWPEKTKLSLRHRPVPPGVVTLPSATIDGQRYASMTEMLRHCVRVTDLGSHTRLVHVSDAADVTEVMRRVMTRFGIGGDAIQYKLFVADQAAEEARELSDDTLLEICKSADRPEKQLLILRKTNPSLPTVSQGSDQESKAQTDTPLSTLPAALSPKVHTAQLHETDPDKTAGGQRGGAAIEVTLGEEARNLEQVVVNSGIRTGVTEETVGKLVLEEAAKGIESTGNMSAEGDSSYLTDSPLDITEDLAPYFPDQRHEIVGIAQILWRRWQMRRESGWSMMSESVEPGDEVRSPKTMSLYGGGKGLVPVLMELMEVEVARAEGEGEGGGKVEKQPEARDAEAGELDLISDIAWIVSAIN